jgi:hypothetical protein
MKSEIRMALLVLASTSAPAFAQDIPQCAALFDNSQNFFSAQNAPIDAINRQCFLTVMPKDGPASLAGFPNLAQYPAPQLMEGTYEIILSGGGGGGGSGGFLSSGGGGAGAVPSKTSQYLSPGVYKLTIGTSGKGGSNGGAGGDGNPTSITKAYTNETVAGFRGADTWTGRAAQSYVVASAGRGSIGGSGADSSGGRGVDGRGNGGAGGQQPDKNGNGEIASQSGGAMVVAGITTGTPGVGGTRDGGGGGGAGFGNGGNGKSGDRAGNNEVGNQGGNGFVMLRPIQLAQATPVAPAPMAAPVQAAPAPYVAPRAAKRDRN